LRDDDVSTAVQSYRAQVDSILDEHRAMFEGSIGDDLDSVVALDHSCEVPSVSFQGAEQPLSKTKVTYLSRRVQSS